MKNLSIIKYSIDHVSLDKFIVAYYNKLRTNQKPPLARETLNDRRCFVHSD